VEYIDNAVLQYKHGTPASRDRQLTAAKTVQREAAFAAKKAGNAAVKATKAAKSAASDPLLLNVNNLNNKLNQAVLAVTNAQNQLAAANVAAVAAKEADTKAWNNAYNNAYVEDGSGSGVVETKSWDGVREDVEGYVKIFNKEKGFGFITINESDTDVYVNVTSIINNSGTLTVGDLVLFDIEDGPNGLVAVNVIKI